MEKRPVLRTLFLLAFLAGSVAIAAALAFVLDLPFMDLLAKGVALGAVLLLLLWLGLKLLNKFLWRVGRRLAFSYLLIGILPIPMVLVLMSLNLYLVAGYFVGHIYRDAATAIHGELAEAARLYLATSRPKDRPEFLKGARIAYASYTEGRKVSGDSRFPGAWPAWLDSPAGKASALGPQFVSFPDSQPTLAATASSAHRAVLALYDGDMQAELADRTGLWVVLLPANEARKESSVHLNLGGKRYSLAPSSAQGDDDARARFFNPSAEERPWWKDPVIWWGEMAGPLLSLDSGEQESEFVLASINGTIQAVSRQLFGGSAEMNAAVWASLIAVTGILGSIYVLAILMAFFMIFSLSRAVNRLSRATRAVQAGDFSTRIPVRRRDQVGELQMSFNEMTANIEGSVAAVAQKEVIEKELKVARDLQQSLLPADIPKSDALDFSTLFEPSAAIGGDYFDILRIDNDRLMVVTADVSGHGLPTGLRMAMLKAALVILVEEGKRPKEILRRLDAMVRAERKSRFFVTATIAVVDFRKGETDLTNAGHPPTYLLRSGEVQEVLLPGNPLGTLGGSYGSKVLQLETDDVLVWLSDGLIESQDSNGVPFGFERVRKSLEGPSTSAADVRNRLLAAEEKHSEGQPAEDDKTLVVMLYRPPAPS
jgi:HAMP domain-containing protein